MNDFSLRAARIQLGALLAALALAIIIALGITTGAFVLSFAVQRDLARQALIPENLTWIFPAIVDSAILGSTIAIVIISKLKMNRRDRGFYIALAVSVVVISILGNAFHAYNAAVDARQVIARGGDLGFIPLAPAIAAVLAIIPPALVLAFTHGITVLVKAVGIAYAAYRELVDSHTVGTWPVAPADETAPPAPVAGKPANVAAKPQFKRRNSLSVFASRASRNAIAGVGALATLALLMFQGPAEAACAGAAGVTAWLLLRRIARSKTAVAPIAATFETAANPVDDFASASDTVSLEPVSLPDMSATPASGEFDALKEFLENSDLPESVKETALLKLERPNLTWEAIAEQSNPSVVTSTAWRRYHQFDRAARAAGFESPPLPDLRAAENPMRTELAAV